MSWVGTTGILFFGLDERDPGPLHTSPGIPLGLRQETVTCTWLDVLAGCLLSPL
jgi:hypothetical protein